MKQERKITNIPHQELLHSLTVRPIIRTEREQWDTLMRTHHYLGLRSLVGESIRYVVTFHEHWLALLSWSAPALKCKPRDLWIGWSHILKCSRLSLIANNTRFLILPPLRIPNLASRILALNLKRLSADWSSIYGHPIFLVETFVDPRFHQGTCYKAAGWLFLGLTKGFAKSSTGYKQHDHPKMVFIKPLVPQAREKLCAPYLTTKIKEVKPMTISRKLVEQLKKELLKIPEPRKRQGIRYYKLSLLLISICAILSNARHFTAIGEWIQNCSQNMRKRLLCPKDKKTGRYLAPNESTIRRFLQKIDAEEVDKRIYDWLSSLSQDKQTIAIDGKTLKGARKEDGKQLHLLSAFLHQQKTVIAQAEVETKTNEIPVARELLKPLDIKGKIVTLDAIHTQKETASYIVEEKGGDYILIVKNNQKCLKQDISDLNMVAFPPSTPNNR